MHTDRNRQIERGMKLAAELPDVMPDQADARIQPIYQDVQRSLRVPIVNLIFRTLANFPDYLEPAWQHVRPVVRSLAFERAADRLRSAAALQPLPQQSGAATDRIGDLDRLRAFNDTIHYVLPKLLLVTTLLDERTRQASEPSGADRPESASPEIPLGIVEGAAKVEMVDADQGGPVGDLFARIKARHAHSLASSYYRGLANWPDFLETAWNRLEARVATADYEDLRVALIGAAEAEIRDLPRIGAIMPALGAQHRDDIDAILAAFRLKFIPEMLIDVTWVKSMLDGPEAATMSRFSAAS